MNDYLNDDEIEFLSDRDKQLLRRNNRTLIRENDLVQDNAQRIRAIEHQLKEFKQTFTPPSMYEMSDSLVRTLTGNDTAHLIATNGIIRIKQRTAAKRAVANFILSFIFGRS